MLRLTLAVAMGAAAVHGRPTGPQEAARAVARHLGGLPQASGATPQPKPFKLFGAVIDTAVTSAARPVHPSVHPEVISTRLHFPFTLLPGVPARDIQAVGASTSPQAASKTGPIRRTRKRPTTVEGRKVRRTEEEARKDKRLPVLERMAPSFPPDHFIHRLVKDPASFLTQQGHPPLPQTPGIQEIKRLQHVMWIAAQKKPSHKFATDPTASGRPNNRPNKVYTAERLGEVDEWQRMSNTSNKRKADIVHRGASLDPAFVQRGQDAHAELRAKILLNRFHARAWSHHDRLAAALSEDLAQVHSHPQNSFERSHGEGVHSKRKERLENVRATLEREFGGQGTGLPLTCSRETLSLPRRRTLKWALTEALSAGGPSPSVPRRPESGPI